MLSPASYLFKGPDRFEKSVCQNDPIRTCFFLNFTNPVTMRVHELNAWELFTNFKEFGINILKGKSRLDGIFVWDFVWE